MKTVVIGASPNPERYAWKATRMLQDYGHEAVPVGLREGTIGTTAILTGQPEVEGVDTVTLYVGQQNQEAWKAYVRELGPRRVIFNPGTENPSWQKELAQSGIQVDEACTLVLLSTGQY